MQIPDLLAMASNKELAMCSMWVPLMVAMWKDNPYWREMLVIMAAFCVLTMRLPEGYQAGICWIILGLMSSWLAITQKTND